MDVVRAEFGAKSSDLATYPVHKSVPEQSLALIHALLAGVRNREKTNYNSILSRTALVWFLIPKFA